MTATTQEARPAWIYRVVPAFDSLRRYRCPTRARTCSPAHGRCRGRAPGDGLRAGRGTAGGIRPLHGDRHDRGRRPFRLVPAADQRPDQRDLDRGADVISSFPARTRRFRPPSCWRSWWADPARHHLAAPGRPDPLHLALGDHRFHPGRLRPARARPDEEPARPTSMGGPTTLPLSVLADDDPGRGRHTATLAWASVRSRSCSPCAG